ncbi:MAG TPA: class I SAM-dependent methyltransferase [Oscillatoriales cyanobacterium M59_W2019_021]|nr:MAG: class I SAM-dependent methyltransferase [Cyanobacteria bacterium J055]HIK30725.1 class I SAM-dependent methyltransferase [Oscillatoriales cyanobacterium M4454_W2019_049]HIK51910.1 class I SAM-dependent methyltransferase [Oscillatoriales cyanobacterium M59_W2019_021]
MNKEKLFDLWASSYDWIFPSVFYQAVHQRLLDYVELPESSRVLDLGCGTGKLLGRLADRFPDLQGTGLDFSEEMLSQARSRDRHPDRLTYVRGTVESLPFDAGQFDAAFSTISFLHYPQPQTVLAEVSRVLRIGGRFYLVDSIPPSWCGSTLSLPISRGGITLYGREARSRLGEAAGLTAIAHRYLLTPVVLTIFQKW